MLKICRCTTCCLNPPTAGWENERGRWVYKELAFYTFTHCEWIQGAVGTPSHVPLPSWRRSDLVLIVWHSEVSQIHCSSFLHFLFGRHQFHAGLDPPRKGNMTEIQNSDQHPTGGARPTLSVWANMYSDPSTTTTPPAAGIDNPSCVKWRKALPSQGPRVHFFLAQGWTNRTLSVHERVDSRFLVLPGSLCIFTQITGHKYFCPCQPCHESKHKSD